MHEVSLEPLLPASPSHNFRHTTRAVSNTASRANSSASHSFSSLISQRSGLCVRISRRGLTESAGEERVRRTLDAHAAQVRQQLLPAPHRALAPSHADPRRSTR
eukprot:626171-Rhodomonas_salina.1